MHSVQGITGYLPILSRVFFLAFHGVFFDRKNGSGRETGRNFAYRLLAPIAIV